MVGVREDEGRAQLAHLCGREGFDGGLCTDGGKDGGFQRSVGGMENSGTGAAIFRVQLKCEGRERHGRGLYRTKSANQC